MSCFSTKLEGRSRIPFLASTITGEIHCILGIQQSPGCWVNFIWLRSLGFLGSTSIPTGCRPLLHFLVINGMMTLPVNVQTFNKRLPIHMSRSQYSPCCFWSTNVSVLHEIIHLVESHRLILKLDSHSIPAPADVFEEICYLTKSRNAHRHIDVTRKLCRA